MSNSSQSLFPLIRRISNPASRLLLRTNATPNQVTFASIVTGIAASIMLLLGTWTGDIACGLLFIVSYVLDNSDGDIARAKGLKSAFGAWLDSTGDFVVHLLFFATLGVAIWMRTDEDLWLWLGGLATLGNVINYVLGRLNDADSEDKQSDGEFKVPTSEDSIGKRLAFIFRELMRADFCFIVLALAIGGQLAVLLPLGAIGAQVYWMTFLAVRKERYHV